MPGTDGASFPFWSPDSRYVGFFAEGKLKKLDFLGGTMIAICGAPEGRGGTWSRDGVILFGTRSDGLFKVSATGGAVLPLTKLDSTRQEVSHRFPQFLPDDNHFLYVSQAPDPRLFLASLDSPQGRLLGDIRGNGVLSEGYLLYVRDNSLLAQPFDAKRLQLTGEPTAVAEKVQTDSQFNFSVFSASGGVLAYQPGAVETGTRLVLMDRTGKETQLRSESGILNSIVLSPQGDRVVGSIYESSGAGPSDVWIYDLQKNTKTKLTFDQNSDYPVWSPDGLRVAFSRSTPNGRELVVKGASGSGEEEVVLNGLENIVPAGFSPDGRYLMYRTQRPPAKIMAVPLSGERKLVLLIASKTTITGASLSPDGRWLAYASSESGMQEVYVVPFHPGAEGQSSPSGKWQVSNGGGAWPFWRPDGKELYFTATSLTSLSAARVNATVDHFETDTPRLLFELSPHPVSGTFCAPTRDGQHFYLATCGPGSTAPLVVTVNWPELLKR